MPIDLGGHVELIYDLRRNLWQSFDYNRWAAIWNVYNSLKVSSDARARAVELWRITPNTYHES